MIVSQHNITIFIRTKDKKRLFFTNCLLRLSFNIISHFEDQSKTHLALPIVFPKFKSWKTQWFGKNLVTILFLSEFTNGQKIAIQDQNQKNEVKS